MLQLKTKKIQLQNPSSLTALTPSGKSAPGGTTRCQSEPGGRSSQGKADLQEAFSPSDWLGGPCVLAAAASPSLSSWWLESWLLTRAVATTISGAGWLEAGLDNEVVGGAKRKLKTDKEMRLWFVSFNLEGCGGVTVTSVELQRHPMATQWIQGSRSNEAPPPLPRRHHNTGGPALDSVRLGCRSLQTHKPGRGHF